MVFRAPIRPLKATPPVSPQDLGVPADPAPPGAGLPAQGTREEPHISPPHNLSLFFFFFLQKRWQKTYDCVKLYLALKGLNHIVNCDPNADWRCGIHSMSVIWGQFKGKKTETMAYKKQHEALGCVLLGRTPFLFPYPRPPPRSILSLLGTLHQGWGWVWKGEGSREEEQGPQTWCLKKEGKYFICKSLFQLLTNTLTKLWGKK